MVFERLFGKGVPELGEEQYIELDTSAGESAGGKIPIRVDKIVDFADTDKIQKSLRDGSVVIVKIKPLKEKDLSELKRAIDKLRKTCVALNGDIAGMDEDWIILTPSFAHVARDM
ncbi:MAG: cell division protein SepF [Candidatus Aenigmatarchaeota archaeon]